MVAIHCAICGDKENTIELYPASFNIEKVNPEIFSARRVPDRMHYRLIRCRRCDLIFSTPILEADKIHYLYKNSQFTYANEAIYLKKTYGGYLRELIAGDRRNLSLLEIGCGSGFFLKEASNLGVGKVFGLEPSKSAIKKATGWLKRRIKADILKPGLFKANSFDIICCFHTLDHVVDPNRFLQITYHLLKKRGKALFIVHDTEGLSVKLLGGRSPIFDIEHIYLFNINNLAKIFIKNDFSLVKTFDVINTYPLIYWFWGLPLPKIVKDGIVKLLNFSKIGNILISLKAGNIGIIVKK